MNYVNSVIMKIATMIGDMSFIITVHVKIIVNCGNLNISFGYINICDKDNFYVN